MTLSRLVPTVFLCLLLYGCGRLAPVPPPPAVTTETRGSIRLAGPAAAAGGEPGLTVFYTQGMYRHIDKMPDFATARRMGTQGKPIPMLNHVGGKKDPVLGSGVARGVGVYLAGRIHFDQRGNYLIQALSNDGIELKITGRTVLLDPTVHHDRLSPPARIQVEQPGWYPLTIRYFQRKGTSALKLFWQPPGQKGFLLVPATALAHPAVLTEGKNHD